MAREVSTCAVCKRDVKVTQAGRFYSHVPYSWKANTGRFTRGIRCLGSGKSPAAAEVSP